MDFKDDLGGASGQTGGVLGPDGRVTHYRMIYGDGGAVISFDPGENGSCGPMFAEDLRRHIHANYDIAEPPSGWRAANDFTDAEKAKLRPIAETLAMLDGNAFFGMTGPQEHYESYLPEASALYEANGGDDGWAGMASFAKP